MSRRHSGLFAAALAGLLITVACNGTEGPLEPAPFGGTASSAGIQAPFVSVRALDSFACPVVQPFLGSFDLTVRALGGRDVFLNQVRLNFTDSTGLSAPSVTLPAPVLTRQFGSTLIAARSQRAFPFSFPFGCFTRRTGTLVIAVVIVNVDGGEETLEARAEVR